MEIQICFFIKAGSAAAPQLFFSQFLFILMIVEKPLKICFI